MNLSPGVIIQIITQIVFIWDFVRNCPDHVDLRTLKLFSMNQDSADDNSKKPSDEPDQNVSLDSDWSFLKDGRCSVKRRLSSFIYENTYICLLYSVCVCVCVCVWSPATHVLGYCGSGCMIDGSARPQSPETEPPDSMSLPVSSDWVCVCVCLNMKGCVCVCVWPVPTPHCNRIGGWGWPASVCVWVYVCVCVCVCVWTARGPRPAERGGPGPFLSRPHV